MISCGYHFVVCVDYEGFMWPFGENNYGQFVTGNKTNFNVPQKILNIPRVLSVSCGSYHTLMITNDDNLWSCGNNDYGQLCLANKDKQLKPQKNIIFKHIENINWNFSFIISKQSRRNIFMWL